MSHLVDFIISKKSSARSLGALPNIYTTTNFAQTRDYLVNIIFLHVELCRALCSMHMCYQAAQRMG